MSGAQVTVSLDEWQDQIKKRADAEADAARLRGQLDAFMRNAPVAETNLVVQDLLNGFAAAYLLVQFLIAHAHPDIVKSQPWPWQALDAFAYTLQRLPGTASEQANNQAAAMDMRLLVEEAKEWNSRRAERRFQATLGGELEPEPTKADIQASLGKEPTHDLSATRS